MAVGPRYWHVYIAVRILCCLIPQTGYLHPDEFFQTTEVVAGDILDVDADKPWEFNSTFPVRSIMLPFCVFGPGYLVMRLLVKHGHFSGELQPPTELLLFIPRLTMLSISLAMDLLMIKIAKNLQVNVYATQWCYATSYILYIYFTRTFTNTFEAFLFTLLLYFCTKQHSHKHNSMDCACVALVMTGGIFNRPTFPAFAFVPIVYWMVMQQKLKLQAFVTEAIQCMIFICMFSLLFILCDTLYFRSLTISELVHELAEDGLSVEKVSEVFVLTPLNFFLYNIRSSNLAVHGIHPHYTHLTLNLVLLFGPGIVCLYYRLFTVLLRVTRTYNNVYAFVLATIFFPILALSVFPHQEARFLVPLLLPFSLLCGHFLFSGKEFSWKFLKLEWLIFNLAAAIFFGFLHQGGVVPSIAFLQKYINGLKGTELSQEYYEYHFIYYHTYPPPVHLFGRLHYSGKSANNPIHIHDLRGTPVENLTRELEIIGERNSTKILLITPATVRLKLCRLKRLKLTHLHSLWPHFTAEDLPTFETMIVGSSKPQFNCNYDSSQQSSNILSNLFHLLHLDIFFVSI